MDVKSGHIAPAERANVQRGRYQCRGHYHSHKHIRCI